MKLVISEQGHRPDITLKDRTWLRGVKRWIRHLDQANKGYHKWPKTLYPRGSETTRMPSRHTHQPHEYDTTKGHRFSADEVIGSVALGNAIYGTEARHAALGKPTPIQFEMIYTTAQAA